MVAISTKTGDDGTTYLSKLRGRVSKADEIVDLIGEIDELQSWLGVLDFDCTAIQKQLYQIMASIAEGSVSQTILYLEALDSDIASSPAVIPNHFILPKGFAHIARAVCRRVERKAVAYLYTDNIVSYFNRLSDWLYVKALENSGVV